MSILEQIAAEDHAVQAPSGAQAGSTAYQTSQPPPTAPAPAPAMPSIPPSPTSPVTPTPTPPSRGGGVLEQIAAEAQQVAHASAQAALPDLLRNYQIGMSESQKVYDKNKPDIESLINVDGAKRKEFEDLWRTDAQAHQQVLDAVNGNAHLTDANQMAKVVVDAADARANLMRFVNDAPSHVARTESEFRLNKARRDYAAQYGSAAASVQAAGTGRSLAPLPASLNPAALAPPKPIENLWPDYQKHSAETSDALQKIAPQIGEAINWQPSSDSPLAGEHYKMRTAVVAAYNVDQEASGFLKNAVDAGLDKSDPEEFNRRVEAAKTARNDFLKVSQSAAAKWEGGWRQSLQDEDYQRMNDSMNSAMFQENAQDLFNTHAKGTKAYFDASKAWYAARDAYYADKSPENYRKLTQAYQQQLPALSKAREEITTKPPDGYTVGQDATHPLNASAAAYERRLGQQEAGALMNDPAFAALSPDEKQKRLTQAVVSRIPDFKYLLGDTTYMTDGERNFRLNGIVKDRTGIDFSQGKTMTALMEASKTERQAGNQIAAAFGGGEVQPFALPATNPEHPTAAAVGRVGAGGLMMATQMLTPGGQFILPATLSIQGVGSARIQGAEENMTAGQTASLAAARGVMNAAIGMIPGGGPAKALTLGTVAKAATTMWGYNVATAVIENKLRDEVGLSSDEDMATFLKAAVDPEGAANAALMGVLAGIHHGLESGVAPLRREKSATEVGEEIGQQNARRQMDLQTRGASQTGQSVRIDRGMFESKDAFDKAVWNHASEHPGDTIVSDGKVIQSPGIRTPASPQQEAPKPTAPSRDAITADGLRALAAERAKSGTKADIELASQLHNVADGLEQAGHQARMPRVPANQGDYDKLVGGLAEKYPDLKDNEIRALAVETLRSRAAELLPEDNADAAEPPAVMPHGNAPSDDQIAGEQLESTMPPKPQSPQGAASAAPGTAAYLKRLQDRTQQASNDRLKDRLSDRQFRNYPWTMTREAWSARAKSEQRLDSYLLEKGITPKEGDDLAINHYRIVENALDEGRKVPDEVLASYPDLAEKYAAPAPPAAPAAPVTEASPPKVSQAADSGTEVAQAGNAEQSTQDRRDTRRAELDRMGFGTVRDIAGKYGLDTRIINKRELTDRILQREGLAEGDPMAQRQAAMRGEPSVGKPAPAQAEPPAPRDLTKPTPSAPVKGLEAKRMLIEGRRKALLGMQKQLDILGANIEKMRTGDFRSKQEERARRMSDTVKAKTRELEAMMSDYFAKGGLEPDHTPAEGEEQGVSGEAPTQAETAKEPWQMTRQQTRDAIPKPQTAQSKQETAARKLAYNEELGRVSNAHRAVIKTALRDGKPVPPEVLADYPDLAKKPIRAHDEAVKPAPGSVPADHRELSLSIQPPDGDMIPSQSAKGGSNEQPTVPHPASNQPQGGDADHRSKVAEAFRRATEASRTRGQLDRGLETQLVEPSTDAHRELGNFAKSQFGTEVAFFNSTRDGQTDVSFSGGSTGGAMPGVVFINAALDPTYARYTTIHELVHNLIGEGHPIGVELAALRDDIPGIQAFRFLHDNPKYFGISDEQAREEIIANAIALKAFKTDSAYLNVDQRQRAESLLSRIASELKGNKPLKNTEHGNPPEISFGAGILNDPAVQAAWQDIQKIAGDIKTFGGVPLDPKLLAATSKLAYAVVKAGAREFAAFVKELSQTANARLRTYLISHARQLYEDVRAHPDAANFQSDMTPQSEIPAKQDDIRRLASLSDDEIERRAVERKAVSAMPAPKPTQAQVLREAVIPQIETAKGTIARTTGMKAANDPMVPAREALAEKLATESALAHKAWLATDARDKIVAAVKELPNELRGDFLHAVSVAKSHAGIDNAMERMTNNLATHRLRESYNAGAAVLANSRTANIPEEYKRRAAEAGQMLRGALEQVRNVPDRPRAKGEPAATAEARDAFRAMIEDYSAQVQKAVADGRRSNNDEVAKAGTMPPTISEAEKASLKRRAADTAHDIINSREQYSYLRRDYSPAVQAAAERRIQVNKQTTGVYNRFRAEALPKKYNDAMRVQADLVRLGWHNRVTDLRNTTFERLVGQGWDRDSAEKAAMEVGSGIPDCGDAGAATIKADPLVRKAGEYWLNNIAPMQDANLERAGQNIAGWASRAKDLADPLDGLMINLPPDKPADPEHFGVRRRSYDQSEALLDPTTGSGEYLKNFTRVVQNNITYPIRARAVAEYARAVQDGGFLLDPSDLNVRQATDGRAYVKVKGVERPAKPVLVDDANGDPQPRFVPLDLVDIHNYAEPVDSGKTKVAAKIFNAYVTARLALGIDVGFHAARELGNVGAVLAREGNLANAVPWAGGRALAAERAYRTMTLPAGDMLQLLAERGGFDRGTGYYVRENEPSIGAVSKAIHWGHELLFHPKYGVDTLLRRALAESYARTQIGADAYNRIADDVNSGKISPAEGADKLGDLLGGENQIGMKNFVNRTVGESNHLLRASYLNKLQFVMPFIGQNIGTLPAEIGRFATGNIPFSAIVQHARRGDYAKMSATVVGGLMSGAMGAYVVANLVNYTATSFDKDENGKKIGGKWLWENKPGHRLTPHIMPGVYWTNTAPGDSRPARMGGIQTAVNTGSVGEGVKDIPRNLVNEIMGMLPFSQAIAGSVGFSPYFRPGFRGLARSQPESLNPMSAGQQTVTAVSQRLRGTPSPQPMGQAVATDLTAMLGGRLGFDRPNDPQTNFEAKVYALAEHSDKPMPDEDLAQVQLRNAVVEGKRSPDPKVQAAAQQRLDEAVKAGQLAPADPKRMASMMRETRVEHALKTLSAQDAVSALEVASDDEKKLYGRVVQQKCINAQQTLPPMKVTLLKRRLDAALKGIDLSTTPPDGGTEE